MEYARCSICHGKMYKPEGKKWRHLFFFDENDHIGDPTGIY